MVRRRQRRDTERSDLGETPPPATGAMESPSPVTRSMDSPSPVTTTDGSIPAEAPGKRQRAVPRTRASTIWAALVPGLVFLVVMLIFILQNFQNVTVSFFSLNGRFPLALCLLFSAILGALIVLCLGAVRVIQLRLAARRNLRKVPPE